jgi:hypothetical protein
LPVKAKKKYSKKLFFVMSVGCNSRVDSIQKNNNDKHTVKKQQETVKHIVSFKKLKLNMRNMGQCSRLIITIRNL